MGDGTAMIEGASGTNIPFIIGGLFLLGLIADLVGRNTFLPRVTLLLLCGVAIGPAGLSLLPPIFVVQWFPTLTTIALALIGFLLGQQLSIPSLKKRGSVVVGISLFKVIGATVFVATALIIFGVNPPVALLLAGIAPATAPASIFDLVHESGATGEFPETLLSIAAIDDVWGLLIFILMMAASAVLSGNASMGPGILEGLATLSLSVLLGLALGIPMAFLTGRIQRGEPTQAEALGFTLLGAGIAEILGILPILTAMVMGITVASLAAHHDRPFRSIQGFEWPFMILFFVLAGASLEMQALLVAGGLTVVYVLSRCLGILAGTGLGSRLMEAPRSLQKWLGVALFPQAGVAIGMALFAAQKFPETASVVLTVIVASTIVLETLGPIFTRLAIRAAVRQ